MAGSRMYDSHNPNMAFLYARRGNTHDMVTGEFMGYVDGSNENTEQEESTGDEGSSESTPCNCGCSKGKKKAFSGWIPASVIILVLILIIYLAMMTNGKK